jgi:hypothetical protein
MSAADLPMPAPRPSRPGLAECHADVCITCSDTAVTVILVHAREAIAVLQP